MIKEDRHSTYCTAYLKSDVNEKYMDIKKHYLRFKIRHY